MTDYDFERVPSEVVKDTAEHGDPTASAVARELLLMRSFASAADATANSLHKVITAIIKRHNGPASIWDFSAWIDGEFRRLRELDRLRAIEAAAREYVLETTRGTFESAGKAFFVLGRALAAKETT